MKGLHLKGAYRPCNKGQNRATRYRKEWMSVNPLEHSCKSFGPLSLWMSGSISDFTSQPVERYTMKSVAN